MEELKLILNMVKDISDGVLWVVILHYIKTILIVFIWASVWICLFIVIKNIVTRITEKVEDGTDYNKLCEALEVKKRIKVVDSGGFSAPYSHYEVKYYKLSDAYDKINELKER